MILNIDLSLWTLILCLNAAGYWMMRTRVKAWAVPVNTLLGIISVTVATVWGCMMLGFTWKSVVTYGIPNGVLCYLGAVALYDFIHEYTKRKEEWKSVWNSFCKLLKKEVKE